ncbi:MAG: amino acid ABC transporter permease [Actinomycetota bacterium]|nr:amino acid ABC transporter permease [Actinomycetota bacterium]
MSEQTALRSPTRGEPIDVADARPRLRPGRIVVSVLIAAVLGRIGWFLVTNERFEWDVVADYLFNRNVLWGLAMSVFLTFVGMFLGSLLGVFLAAGQLHTFGPVRWVCQLYVGVFRGIPPLVQLIFWYNLAFLVPRIGIGIPYGPELVSWSSNDLITPLTAAIIGLSLHEAAYMAEIFRSGILSVDHGQRDAAAALGFSGRQTFWRVVLPQSMRIILPPTGSQFISLMKGTSLVSVIAMNDLLRSVQLIYNRTYEVVPMLMVAVIWYLVVVTLLTIVQRRIEARFSRGYDRTSTTSASVAAPAAEGAMA